LAGAEVELVSAMSREWRLRQALESVREQYEVLLIDSPPSLSLLTINALAAADCALVPIQCEYYALEGISQLLKTLTLVKQHGNWRNGSHCGRPGLADGWQRERGSEGVRHGADSGSRTGPGGTDRRAGCNTTARGGGRNSGGRDLSEPVSAAPVGR